MRMPATHGLREEHGGVASPNRYSSAPGTMLGTGQVLLLVLMTCKVLTADSAALCASHVARTTTAHPGFTPWRTKPVTGLACSTSGPTRTWAASVGT